MSYIDLNHLTPSEIICQFILDRRGRGPCLPYKEMRLIDTWLDASGQNVDHLLLVLSDLIPEKPGKTSDRPLPLKIYHKKVLERIKIVSTRK